MLQINQLKMPVKHTKEQLRKKIMTILHIAANVDFDYIILRRSIDARKKPEIFYIYSVEVSVPGEEKIYKNVLKRRSGHEQISISTRKIYQFPSPKEEVGKKTIVVGSGPAGLFCTYLLALAGQRPILLERGEEVSKRRESVAKFWETNVLAPNSNVQFGEGGAGTFSDGKLNTLVKDKDGRNRAVLETFVKFGAKESIVYDAKPHIGTDVLCEVVENMRKEIIRLGGTVYFDSQVTELCIDKQKRVTGVVVNGKEFMECSQVVLAIGHSARDTFEMLYQKEIPMEQKAFAVGFRIEHPQKMMNISQYATEENEILGAAPYKVTAKTTTGRGVYSFCMCPGGYVVNASSEQGHLAVNGMSYSKRDSKNANSAIIVSVGPSDFGSEHPLAGIEFQRDLEKRAYDLANGKIPIQRYGDFRKNVVNESEFDIEDENINAFFKDFEPCSKGMRTWANLSTLLPKECNVSFVEGVEQFGKQIRGFNHKDAILSGVESRTSCPVRILRDETLQSKIKGLYPCGEGAGYAGGITSAAMDGMRIAEAILAQY